MSTNASCNTWYAHLKAHTYRLYHIKRERKSELRLDTFGATLIYSITGLLFTCELCILLHNSGTMKIVRLEWFVLLRTHTHTHPYILCICIIIKWVSFNLIITSNALVFLVLLKASTQSTHINIYYANIVVEQCTNIRVIIVRWYKWMNQWKINGELKFIKLANIIE